MVKNDENSDMEKHTASYEYRSTFTVLQTTRDLCAFTDNFLTFNHLHGRIKTAQQRTIIQQYGNWYTAVDGCMGCYIWYSEEETGRAVAPPSPLLAVPNVTAHPSTASTPTSYYSMWHYNAFEL